MKKKSIISFICALAVAICSIWGMIPASAGSTGMVLADKNDFIGTELDYADWSYNRNAGVGFREVSRVFGFDKMTGDDLGLKSKNALPQGSGSAVDMEFVKLDLKVTGGWPGIAYGSAVEGNVSAFWNLLNQDKTENMPVGELVTGELHYFSGSSTVAATFMNPYNKSATGRDYKGIATTGVTVVKPTGTAAASGYNLGISTDLSGKTLREYYGADGKYELSIRDNGAPVSERTVLLQIEGLRPNPGGYIGLVCMSMRNGGMEMSDFAIYEADSASKENSALRKVSGFKKTKAEGETLDDFEQCALGNSAGTKKGSIFAIGFDKTSDMGNPLLNRIRVRKSPEKTIALQGDFKLRINEMTAGKQFGAVLGVKSLIGDAGDDGSAYLYFQKAQSGYEYGLSLFNEGQEVQLVAPTALPAGVNIAEELSVAFTVQNDGVIDLFFDGARVYKGGKDLFDVTGYFGFAQTGFTLPNLMYIDVDILDMNLRNEYYAKQTTPDSFMNFDDNAINQKEWYINSKGYTGSGIRMENGKLLYDGVQQNSNITSVYSYSNFELRFDVSDALNNPIKDLQGNVTAGASYWLGITFGGETADAPGAAVTYQDDITGGCFLHFTADTDQTTGERNGDTNLRFVYKGVYQPAVPVPEKYAFFNKDFDTTQPVTIDVKVLDGTMTVGMKLPSEAQFTTLYTFTFDNEYTPTGHVSIFGEGNNFVTSKVINIASQFALDNLGLYNWDEGGEIIEPGYESNVPEFLPDYDYVDDWVYEDSTAPTTTSGGCKKSNNATAALPVGGLMLAAGIVIVRYKK